MPVAQVARRQEVASETDVSATQLAECVTQQLRLMDGIAAPLTTPVPAASVDQLVNVSARMDPAMVRQAVSGSLALASELGLTEDQLRQWVLGYRFPPHVAQTAYHTFLRSEFHPDKSRNLITQTINRSRSNGTFWVDLFRECPHHGMVTLLLKNHLSDGSSTFGRGYRLVEPERPVKKWYLECLERAGKVHAQIGHFFDRLAVKCSAQGLEKRFLAAWCKDAQLVNFETILAANVICLQNHPMIIEAVQERHHSILHPEFLYQDSCFVLTEPEYGVQKGQAERALREIITACDPEQWNVLGTANYERIIAELVAGDVKSSIRRVAETEDHLLALNTPLSVYDVHAFLKFQRRFWGDLITAIDGPATITLTGRDEVRFGDNLYIVCRSEPTDSGAGARMSIRLDKPELQHFSIRIDLDEGAPPCLDYGGVGALPGREMRRDAMISFISDQVHAAVSTPLYSSVINQDGSLKSYDLFPLGAPPSLMNAHAQSWATDSDLDEPVGMEGRLTAVIAAQARLGATCLLRPSPVSYHLGGRIGADHELSKRAPNILASIQEGLVSK